MVKKDDMGDLRKRNVVKSSPIDSTYQKMPDSVPGS